MANYEVIVSNIGKVYEGGFYQSALDDFTVYKNRSLKGIGRAAGESVTLIKDGEILQEYNPQESEEEQTDSRDYADVIVASGLVSESARKRIEQGGFYAQEQKPEPESIDTRLLETLRALTDWAREHTSPLDADSPHELLIRAVAVIDEADKRRGEAKPDEL